MNIKTSGNPYLLVLNHVGNGWVAGGCWDDDITIVMTGIIPENSLRLAPVSKMWSNRAVFFNHQNVMLQWITKECHSVGRKIEYTSIFPEVSDQFSIFFPDQSWFITIFPSFSQDNLGGTCFSGPWTLRPPTRSSWTSSPATFRSVDIEWWSRNPTGNVWASNVL